MAGSARRALSLCFAGDPRAWRQGRLALDQGGGWAPGDAGCEWVRHSAHGCPAGYCRTSCCAWPCVFLRQFQRLLLRLLVPVQTFAHGAFLRKWRVVSNGSSRRSSPPPRLSQPALYISCSIAPFDGAGAAIQAGAAVGQIGGIGLLEGAPAAGGRCHRAGMRPRDGQSGYAGCSGAAVRGAPWRRIRAGSAGTARRPPSPASARRVRRAIQQAPGFGLGACGVLLVELAAAHARRQPLRPT